MVPITNSLLKPIIEIDLELKYWKVKGTSKTLSKKQILITEQSIHKREFRGILNNKPSDLVAKPKSNPVGF